MLTGPKRSKFERFKKRLVFWIFFGGIIMATFIPTWLYLLARFAFSPDNALTEIFLLGVSLYFLGGLQIVFVIVGVIFLTVLCDTW